MLFFFSSKALRPAVSVNARIFYKYKHLPIENDFNTNLLSLLADNVN